MAFDVHKKDSFARALAELKSNVVWRCIEALLDYTGPNESAIAIAKRIGVSVEEVVECIEGLKTLGILVPTDKGFIKKNFQMLLLAEENDLAKEKKSHQRYAEQVIMKLHKSYSGFAWGTHAANKQLLAELHQEVLAAMSKFGDRGRSAPADGIYALEFSGVQFIDFGTEGKSK